MNAACGSPFLTNARGAPPRREQPDRYQPKPLTGEQVAHFYARVDAIRERRTRRPKPGNVEAFRLALEQMLVLQTYLTEQGFPDDDAPTRELPHTVQRTG